MNDKLVLIISGTAVFDLTLMAVLSWIKSKNKPSAFWLGCMFFAASAAILNNTCIFDNNGSIILYHIGVISNLSFGGLLISFVKSFLNPKSRIIHFDWRLFIPSFLYLPFIALCIIEPHWSTNTIDMSEAGQMSVFGKTYNLMIVFYSIGSNIYMLWKIRKLKSIAKAVPAKTIKEFLLMMLILQLVAFVPFILKLNIRYIILYMPIVGQIFFLYIFVRMSFSMNLFNYHGISQFTTENNLKYATVKFKEDKAEQVLSQIIELINTKKPYLRIDYTLTEMAKDLNILPTTLSMIINSKLNCSFPDYINSFRVKKSVELLNNEINRNFTIEAIAYESGFNNRTSFYKAFKKQTGKLPSEYLKKRQKKELV